MSIISQIISGLQSDQDFESKSLDVSTLPSLSLSQKRELPEVPAIYFCISETEEILYIGRTKNLSNRWIAHHRYSELKGIKKVKLAWLEVSDLALLPQIESALIEYFKPPFNGLKVPDLVTENIKKEKSIRIQRQISLESEAQIEALERLSKELGFKFGVKPNISGLIQVIADGNLLLVPSVPSKSLLPLALLKAQIAKLSELANLSNKANETELLEAIANEELTIIPRTEPMTQIERETLELIYRQQPFALNYTDATGRLWNFEFLYASRVEREGKYYLEGWSSLTQGNLDIPELAHNWSLRFDRFNDAKLIPLDNAQWKHDGLDTIEVTLEFKGALAYAYSSRDNDIDDVWEGSTRRVTRRITNTFWFVREVLSYGRSCVVVSPDNVVAKIKEELYAMVGNY